MVVQVFCPAAAAMGEVLAVGDQALVQVAGEQRDAVRAGVMPEEVAGHADLAAAAGAEHVLIEPGPVLDRINARGLQPGDLDRHHGDFRGRSPVAGLGILSSPPDARYGFFRATIAATAPGCRDRRGFLRL